MKRDRAYRRHQSERVERRRYKSNYHRWIKRSGLDAEWRERFSRRLRDSNGSCGCGLCKPWKFGLECPDKTSVRRGFDSVKDKANAED